MLQECGPPTSSDVIGEETIGYYQDLDMEGDRTSHNRRRFDTFGAYREISRVVETWHYNCGSNDFNAVLTFRGSSLADIDRTSYGSGESDCIGAEVRKRRELQKKEMEENIKKRREEGLDIHEGVKDGSYYDQIDTRGDISISGSPSRAKVYLDGNHLGYIPCTLYEIKDGPHFLEANAEGYEDYKEEINVRAGEILKIMIRLKKK